MFVHVPAYKDQSSAVHFFLHIYTVLFVAVIVFLFFEFSADYDIALISSKH